MKERNVVPQISCFTILAVFALIAPLTIAAQGNSVPFITEPVLPSAQSPGSPMLNVSIRGTGFVAGSIVKWNGNTIQTKVISDAQLTATVPAGNLTNPGTFELNVTNPAPGGGTSNALPFEISNATSALGFGGPGLQSAGSCGAAVADLNLDGKADLITSDCSGVVSVRIGNGDGTFKAPVAYSIGSGTVQTLTLADLNGDGRVDVAATVFGKNGGESAISILLGNGDGTFQSHIDTIVGFQSSSLVSVVAADFNRDGRLDLAVGDTNFAAIWVLVGNGDGTFQTALEYPGMVADYLTLGDFNGDGKLDIAAGGTTGVTSTISLMLGNGDGTFQSPTNKTTSGSVSVTTADINDDGKLDLIAASGSPGTQVIVVLLGRGDGTFDAERDYDVGVAPHSVVIGDFNADGVIDAAVTNSCGSDISCNSNSASTVSILLGNGDGTFQNHIDFPTNSGPTAMSAGDFNGDGKPDLVIGGANIGILLQTTVGLSSGSLLFADQNGGTISPPQTVTVTNTASTALSISSITLGGVNPGDFAQTNNCGTNLAAGANCTLNVTFSPLGSGVRVALITLTDNAIGSTQQIALTGTGTTAVVSLNPPSLNFGTQIVNQVTPVQMVTLTNTGNATLNITKMAVTGDFLMRSPCPATLAVNASCTFAVAFKPSSKGAKIGAVTFTDNAAGSPQSLPLSGTGTLVAFSPMSLNFGNVKKGTTSAPQTITLTNNGTSALNVTKVSFNGNNAKDFSQTNTCGTSVAAKGTCTISVTFTPSVASFRQSNVAVYDSGGGSPQLTPVSGSGTN